MRSISLRLAGLACLAMLLVGLLLWWQPSSPPGQGGFTRQSRSTRPLRSLDLGVNSYYLAGLAADTLYLATQTAPDHLLMVTVSSLDTSHRRISLPQTVALAWPRLKHEIHPPFVFSVDPVSRQLSLAHLEEGFRQVFPLPDRHFSQTAVVSPASLWLKTYDIRLRQGILRKLPLRAGPDPRARLPASPEECRTYQLEKQVDGHFCVDGRLSYHPALGQGLYLYYYRNAFTLLDSNLIPLYRAQTLDTNRRVTGRLTEYQQGSRTVRTWRTPPHLLHAQGQLSARFIYILSHVRATNESHAFRERQQTLDLYDRTNGTYRYSLYLPGQPPIREFRVGEKYLLALSGNHLLRLELPAEPAP